MRFSKQSMRAFALVALICAGLTASHARAAPPRAADDIMEDVDKAASQLGDISVLTIGDPRERAGDAKYVPTLRKLVALGFELAANPDPGERVKGAILISRYRSLLVALNDEPTIQQADLEAHAGDPSKAAAARTDLIFGRWLKSASDAQPALAEEASALARDNSGNEQLAAAVYTMTQVGHPSEVTTTKLEDALLQMNNKTAKEFGEQVQSVRKLRKLVGAPLTVRGMLLGQPGKELSTDSFKGKVVLVDFWATWCGPCLKTMPHVQSLYKAIHADGFEVVGVSCDDDVADLNKYLKANPATAWPQLYDGMSPGWNPIATKLGVSGLPTMILIDRKGIVRSVEAEQNLDALVRKLLAEPK
jgi:thiol-disulfide isomerase/thioredoxin